MAQVVAMQRGATNVSGTGTSSATLFTQSATGNGTRVITNMMMIKVDKSTYTSQISGGQYAIYHNSSAGGSQLIGYWSQVWLQYPTSQNYAIQNNSQSVIQMHILNDESSVRQSIQAFPGNPAYQYGGALQSNGPIIQSTNWYNFNDTGVSNGSVQSMLLTRPLLQYNTQSLNYFINFIPRNFWIGPSDTITVKANYSGVYYVPSGKSSYPVYGYPNVQFNYSFTTVTET